MSGRTLEQAEKVIEQLELKNLELQRAAIQHEMAAMDITMQLFTIRGPMLEHQLRELDKSIQERTAKRQLAAVATVDRSAQA